MDSTIAIRDSNYLGFHVLLGAPYSSTYRLLRVKLPVLVQQLQPIHAISLATILIALYRRRYNNKANLVHKEHTKKSELLVLTVITGHSEGQNRVSSRGSFSEIGHA